MFLGNSTITRIRRTPAVDPWATGDYDPGTESATTISAVSVQPLTDAERLNLPERLQRTARFKLYVAASADLRLGSDDADEPPDLVEFEGERYRLYGARSYPSFLIRHARYIMAYPESAEDRPDGRSPI